MHTHTRAHTHNRAMNMHTNVGTYNCSTQMGIKDEDSFFLYVVVFCTHHGERATNQATGITTRWRLCCVPTIIIYLSNILTMLLACMLRVHVKHIHVGNCA